jgi:antitoxin component of MazEF toxin-antitoxin module
MINYMVKNIAVVMGILILMGAPLGAEIPQDFLKDIDLKNGDFVATEKNESAEVTSKETENDLLDTVNLDIAKEKSKEIVEKSNRAELSKLPPAVCWPPGPPVLPTSLTD